MCIYIKEERSLQVRGVLRGGCPAPSPSADHPSSRRRCARASNCSRRSVLVLWLQ
jgi:hypothetical protein